MYGWNEKPTKVEPKYSTTDSDGVVGCVYQIGSYDVTVASNGTVTYRHRYNQNYDPRQTLPNMEVRDGEIRIPATDLVGLILSRLDPVEIAQALWSENEDVRNAFIDCAVTRYSEAGVGDPDRRKLLHGLQETVHSVALDKLRDAMAAIEYDLSRRSHFFHEVLRINDMLRDLDIRTRQGDLLQIAHHDNDPDFRIGGKVWNEARDDWRELVLERFPPPAALETVPAHGDDEIAF